jgi:hypothetical protein
VARQAGRDEKAREIAYQLLGQFDDQRIAELTGLSLAELATLRREGTRTTG